MYSIKFPEMFTRSRTQLIQDKEAVKQNIYLILRSNIGTLFGDPGFGNKLKEYIFEQNNTMIIDLIIDEIYTCLKLFIPQITVVRKNITVTQSKDNLYANVRITYNEDLTSDLYQISLLDTGDNV